MTALPPHTQAEKILSAYAPTSESLSLYRTTILPAEEAASSGRQENAHIHLMQARVVGYLLLYFPFPSRGARQAFESEIASCRMQADTHAAIFELGAKYITHLIAICELFFAFDDEHIWAD